MPALSIPSEAKKLVLAALMEDQAWKDITSQSLFQKELAKGWIIFKGRRAVVCGLPLVRLVFQILDPKISIRFLVREGSEIRRGVRVAYLKGKARVLLAGERSALNFLGHLSGVASQTREYVREARRVCAKFIVSDTRKTLPLLRALEKMAVEAGGGTPHRSDLLHMAMVKDNHLRILKRCYGKQWPQRLSRAVDHLRREGRQVEVEAQSLEELPAILEAHPDWIMLDNMSFNEMKKAIRQIHSQSYRMKIEVSGGIRLKDIKRLASLAIDRVSIGAIVHSAAMANFSLELV